MIDCPLDGCADSDGAYRHASQKIDMRPQLYAPARMPPLVIFTMIRFEGLGTHLAAFA